MPKIVCIYKIKLEDTGSKEIFKTTAVLSCAKEVPRIYAAVYLKCAFNCKGLFYKLPSPPNGMLVS
jgi:hypothetical protein